MRVHREDHVLAQLRLVALADLRPFDHRHPDRVAGHVPEGEAAVEEALRDGAVDVVSGCAVLERAPRRVVVLLVRLHHLRALGTRRAGADRARDLDPVAADTGYLERRQHHVARLDRVVAGDLELRQSGAAVADEHHVHRQTATALLDEVLLAVREDLALALAGREMLEEDPEALGVDADAVAHGLELELALDGTRVIELDVPRHDLRGAVQRTVVAHGHHVVEAVDADALAPNLVGEPFARLVDEDLLVDPRRSVLPDVRRLTREDDRRLALARQ